jgi:primosomal protein N' (replication factor Y)
MSKIIQVAVLLPLNQLFDYAIPDDIDYIDIIGKRVLVPLGSRTVTGIAVSANQIPSAVQLKPIIEILDETQIFDDNMLKLTKWVSDYYLASWGEVLKAALPPNFNLSTIKKIKILIQPTDFELIRIRKKAPKRYKLLNLLLKTNGNISINNIEKEIDLKNIAPQLEALSQLGYIEIYEQLEKQVETKVIAYSINTDFASNEEKLKSYFDKFEKKSPKRIQVISYLITEKENGKNEISLVELNEKLSLSPSILQKLVEDNIITKITILKPIQKDNSLNLANDESKITLNAEQKEVVDNIKNSINLKCFSSHLLFGVTGSGKTLVYVNLIKEVLSKGKTALLLLPEISLTPQLVDRVQAYFKQEIAVLHSSLSDNERNQIFNNLHKGNYNICMGVRSSVFAPIKNLGLIIVDEEHDSSYKQDHPSPRYNARDTAIMRARFENIPIVMGSGTPSLESWHNVDTGIHKIHRIINRADGAKLPIITIVDMREERKNKTIQNSFSNILIEKIVEKIKSKEGVIIFQNRRGFSPQLYCTDCGNVPMCENCDISLTYHKSSEKLICHYCGAVHNVPKICNVCGSDELQLLGYGTQRIEESLQEILIEMGVDAKIKRFDKDSTSRKNAHRRLMWDFMNGDIDVLVGTQMLSKGIDIPRVSLVGIVDADMHLFFPDFRANERTFQLLTQVAGRAGRKSAIPGEVIIQTSHPDNFAITSIRDYNLDEFYAKELYERKSFKYPPFTRITKIEFTSEDFEITLEAARNFRRLIPNKVQNFIITEPIIPSITRINNKFRIYIFIRSSKIADKSGNLLQNLISKTLNEFTKLEISKRIRTNIDIDSYNNM